MKKPLKCILLVDDDDATNFLHQDVLQDVGISKNIEVAETAMEALQLLRSPRINDCQNPDIIFLDLNMPGMNGWDFIDQYAQMKNLNSTSSLIFILTTSSNPDDKKKAAGIKEISGFLSKPLTEDMITNILNQHFSA